jgi:hypothetical protein
MDFGHLIRHYKLVDVVSVDDVNYAIATAPISVPNCTTLLVTQLPNYLLTFLAKGYSQRHNTPYSLLAGVESWIVFSYTLTHLPATKKQIFSHALAGTGGRRGLLASWNGQKIGRSAFFVPKSYEEDVTSFFNQWYVPYKTEVVLRGN